MVSGSAHMAQPYHIIFAPQTSIKFEYYRCVRLVQCTNFRRVSILRTCIIHVKAYGIHSTNQSSYFSGKFMLNRAQINEGRSNGPIVAMFEFD